MNAAPHGVSLTSDSLSDNTTETVLMVVSVCLAVRLCFVYRLRGSSILMKHGAKNSLTRWFSGREEVPASLFCISWGRGSLMNCLITSRLEHSLDLSPELMKFFVSWNDRKRVGLSIHQFGLKPVYISYAFCCLYVVPIAPIASRFG